MSLSVLRGGALGAPTPPRGAPGPSFESAGRPVAEPSSVRSPVLASSDRVVTVARNSLSTYTNLLSRDVMKWRGSVMAFIWKVAGVIAVRCPDFASNVNWNIWSVPSVGASTNWERPRGPSGVEVVDCGGSEGNVGGS